MDLPDAPLNCVRAVLLAVVVTVVGAGAAACGPGTTPTEQADNQEIVEGIAAGLADDGLTVETAAFRDDAENDAKVYLFLRCHDCREDQVVHRAVRAVWTSTVRPLHTFSVRVVDTVDLEQARRDVVVAAEESELTEEVGSRPAPTGAAG